MTENYSIEDFFKLKLQNYIQYVNRVDFIGGHLYIKLSREAGKVILSIGDDNEGEIQIKVVQNAEEVNNIIKDIYY